MQSFGDGIKVNTTSSAKSLSVEMIKAVFNSCTSYFMAGYFEYHYFPAKAFSKGTILVDAGFRLKRRGPPDGIQGVNIPYWLLGITPYTITPMHIEDGGLGSVNLVVGGAPKLWLVISPADKEKLEEILCRFYKNSPTCLQRVRHFNVLISPSNLRDWGIRYQVKAYEPGELIFTVPNNYHQIVNQGMYLA